jgi:SAM-dependent methyltransferase
MVRGFPGLPRSDGSAPRCRACLAGGLAPILSLGRLPLANQLVDPQRPPLPEPVYPLDLVICPRCRLVQITETVAPEVLFRQYLYFSSYSDTAVAHAGELARRMVKEAALDPGSLVIEIGSNDGYLLQHYRAAGIPVLGIEPAVNIARVASERGIPTMAEFFSAALARRLRADGVRPRIVHLHNVLAHVADLNGVVEGIGVILAEGGTVIIEVPYLRDLIDHGEFDTIYHEHLCYFSLTALDRLFRRHRLAPVRVERIPIHGGSLRLFVQALPAEVDASLTGLLEEERHWGVDDWAPYAGFAKQVKAIQRELRQLLASLKASGKRIAGYGAAAKGSTLLNSCGIGAETIDFIVDRNEHKQGLLMAGTRIPIVPPQALASEMPDYVLLLTWNFADEIMAQQRAYRERGGTFIIPIPTPTLRA